MFLLIMPKNSKWVLNLVILLTGALKSMACLQTHTKSMVFKTTCRSSATWFSLHLTTSSVDTPYPKSLRNYYKTFEKVINHKYFNIFSKNQNIKGFRPYISLIRNSAVNRSKNRRTKGCFKLYFFASLINTLVTFVYFFTLLHELLVCLFW